MISKHLKISITPYQHVAIRNLTQIGVLSRLASLFSTIDIHKMYIIKFVCILMMLNMDQDLDSKVSQAQKSKKTLTLIGQLKVIIMIYNSLL